MHISFPWKFHQNVFTLTITFIVLNVSTEFFLIYRLHPVLMVGYKGECHVSHTSPNWRDPWQIIGLEWAEKKMKLFQDGGQIKREKGHLSPRSETSIYHLTPSWPPLFLIVNWQLTNRFSTVPNNNCFQCMSGNVSVTLSVVSSHLLHGQRRGCSGRATICSS